MMTNRHNSYQQKGDRIDLVKIASLSILTLILIAHCASNESMIPEREVDISYSDFETKLVDLLISSSFNLKIDTVYSDTSHKEYFDIPDSVSVQEPYQIHFLVAFETYPGREHKKWFFWKATWVEKTIYFIQFRESKDGVAYSIRVESYEAPSLDYETWQLTSPSKPTKEPLITQYLANE